jgi:hypothetical protein
MTQKLYGRNTERALVHIDDYTVVLKQGEHDRQVSPMLGGRRAGDQNIVEVHEGEGQVP